MKKIALLLLMFSIFTALSGCGETLSGLGKDAGRMGKGINTFFFRQ